MRTGTRVKMQKVLRNGSLLAAFLLSIFGVSGTLKADVYTFAETDDAGFGDAKNKAGLYDNAVVEFNGDLYVSVENTTTGAQLWRTSTGNLNSWEPVVEDGFGDDKNIGIGTLIVFKNRLYAGTINTTKGAEVWRSIDGDSWEPVVASEADGNAVGADENGFSLGNNTNGKPAAWGVGGAAVINNQLFIGTLGNATIRRTEDGVTWNVSSNEAFNLGVDLNISINDMVASDTYLYAAVGNTNLGGNRGAQVWRCNRATLCDAQGDWARVTTPGLGVVGATIDQAYALEIYNKDLYLSTDEAQADKGGQIWKCAVESSCAEQQKWSQVIATGFGNQDGNSDITELYSYANELYAFTRNDTDGAELYRSRDGSTYELVSDAGLLEDAQNKIGRKLIAFQNDLHAFMNMKNGLVSARKNLDPTLNFVFASPRKDGTGGSILGFRFDDPDDTTNGRALVEYSLNGGANYQKATLSLNGADTGAIIGDPSVKNSLAYPVYGIDASQGANPVSVVWNSKVDVPNQEVASAKFRITPFDGFGTGVAFTSPNFKVDNLKPTIKNLLVLPGQTRAGVPLTITFSVTELLNANPAVSVDGNAAVLSAVNGFAYTYTYLPTGEEAEGAVNVVNVVADTYLNQTSDTEGIVFDFTAPESVADPIGGTYQSAQDVVLTADDTGVQGVSLAGTGVSHIYYTTDGSEPTTASTEYVSPIRTADSGTTTIRYFSTDAVGNTEGVQTSSYIVDAGAPAGDRSFIFATVFHDTDRDATEDANENGISGVTVRLYNDVDADGVLDGGSDTLVGTTVSAATGDVSFLGLAQGVYLISVDASTIPSGYTLTTGNNPGAATLSSPGQGLTAAFGYAAPPTPPGSGNPGNGGNRDDDGTPSTPPDQNGDGDGDGTQPSQPSQPDTGSPDQTPPGTPNENGNGQQPSLPDRLIGGIKKGIDAIFGKKEKETAPNGKENTKDPSTGNGQTQRDPTSAGSQNPKDSKKSPEQSTPIERIVRTVIPGMANAGFKLFLAEASLAALVIAAANLGFASQGLVSYVRFLLQLMTEPFRLLAGHRKRRWGVVFDAQTGKPIDLVLVRLFDASSGRLLQTNVSDHLGRYLFLVPETGSYRLTATRKSYVFPPEHVLPARPGLYQGGVIAQDGNISVTPTPVVESKEAEASVIRLDIPMSQTEGEIFLTGSRKPVRTQFTSLTAFAQARRDERAFEDRKMRRAHQWRRFALMLSFLGPLTGIVTFVLQPSWFTGILLLLHVLLFLLFRRLAVAAARKPWGRVLDLGEGKQLAGAVVRLFDEKYGKLLLVKVTGQDGRYAFLTGSGRYQLHASKEQYLFPDGATAVGGGSAGEVSKDLGMRREA